MAVYAHRGLRTVQTMKDGPTEAEPRKKLDLARPGATPRTSNVENDPVNIDDYALPVIDVQVARRNFPGYDRNTYMTQEDLIGVDMNDTMRTSGDSSGTTDTDSITHTNTKGGYTRIYDKLMGKARGRPTKSSSARAR